MTDEKSRKSPGDSSRININEQYEIDYWTHRLKITADQLKEAVNKVGPLVRDVKAYLKQ